MIRLLDAGAFLHAIDREGDTAFHVACLKGHYDAAMTLKERGASLVTRNLKNMTPLHCAARGGNPKIVQELLGSSECDTQDDRGMTPLMHTFLQKHEGAAVVLLEAGVRHDIAAFDGMTALHLAAHFSERGVKALLDKKAQSVADRERMIPLHIAALSGEEAIVDLLLPISDVNAQECMGLTPLSTALVEKKEACALKLLVANARFDLVSNKKVTPLHIAARQGLKKAVEDLLERGADPLAKDEDGVLPITQARDKEIKDRLADAIALKRNQATLEEI